MSGDELQNSNSRAQNSHVLSVTFLDVSSSKINLNSSISKNMKTNPPLLQKTKKKRKFDSNSLSRCKRFKCATSMNETLSTNSFSISLGKYNMKKEDEFYGQFQCTYQRCNKLLSNNVSLMYHLWAHVGFFQKRGITSDASQITDEVFTRMCSTCLSIFDTAFEKTRHSLEVHRNAFKVDRLCHVCEINDENSNFKHGSTIFHRKNELPYVCRKCDFRCNSRMALFNHFSQIHIGTAFLICPFCPFNTEIPPSERLTSIVSPKHYVEHVTNHGNFVAQKCSSCAYKFIDDLQFNHHLKDHENERYVYPIQSKCFKLIKNDALTTKPRKSMLTLLKCVECSSQFLKAEEHYKNKQKCDRCSFETYCIISYWNHMHLSTCDPSNKERLTLAVTKDVKWMPPKCERDIRISLSVMKSKAFTQHFRMFRDFSFDRKPSEKMQKDIEAEEESISEHNNSQGEYDVKLLKFIREIRVPHISLCEEFLFQKRSM